MRRFRNDRAEFLRSSVKTACRELVEVVSSSHPQLHSAPAWNRTEHWCVLCREPHNSWNEHRGKRDHICLQIIFDAIHKYGHRRWDPFSVWNMAVGPSTRSRLGVAEALEHLNHKDEHERRQEIFMLLKFMMSEGIVFVGRSFQQSPFARQPVGLLGSLLLFRELHTPLIAMFPNCDAKELSAITQMVSATYNHETVFDLCGFRYLLISQEALTKRVARGEVAGGGGTDDLLYHQKGTFIRNVLGQVRWALEPESVCCPFPAASDTHIAVLAEVLARMLIAEIVTCKICEYVCRVEGVWREWLAKQSEDVSGVPCHFPSTPQLLSRVATPLASTPVLDDFGVKSMPGNSIPASYLRTVPFYNEMRSSNR